MDVRGILHKKFDSQQVSDKFKKREFVLMIDPSSPYPQPVCFQLVNDKTSLIDNFQCGQEITVSFSMRGREWTSPQGETKYFNTLDAWRIQGANSSNNGHHTDSAPHRHNAPPQNNNSVPDFSNSGFGMDDDSDLPF